MNQIGKLVYKIQCCVTTTFFAAEGYPIFANLINIMADRQCGASYFEYHYQWVGARGGMEMTSCGGTSFVMQIANYLCHTLIVFMFQAPRTCRTWTLPWGSSSGRGPTLCPTSTPPSAPTTTIGSFHPLPMRYKKENLWTFFLPQNSNPGEFY